jgi:hypothetical protein
MGKIMFMADKKVLNSYKHFSKIYNSLNMVSGVLAYIYSKGLDLGIHIQSDNTNIPYPTYEEKDEGIIAHIYVSGKSKNIINDVYFSIGRIVDSILGCDENNKEITKENLEATFFSTTNKDFIENTKLENDFFTQIKRPEVDELYEYDLKNSFAECFTQLALSKKKQYMYYTKCVIVTILNKHIKKAA